MGTVNLYDGDQTVLDTSLDNVTIVKMIECLPVGGRSLNIAGYKPPTIQAGHVIIRDKTTNDYKPMPVNDAGDAYAALPADHDVVGVAYSSALTKLAFMTIMVRGTVNQMSCPYPYTEAIKTKLSPNILFTQD